MSLFCIYKIASFVKTVLSFSALKHKLVGEEMAEGGGSSKGHCITLGGNKQLDLLKVPRQYTFILVKMDWGECKALGSEEDT
jgi:hypothetical protein